MINIYSNIANSTELFRIIWKYIVIIDIIVCLYYFFIKISFFSHFDSFDYFDYKYLLRIFFLQILIWGTTLVWAFPLIIIIFLIPYLYVVIQYIYNKEEFVYLKEEFAILNLSIIIWILALLHKIFIYKKDITFDYYTYLFLFQRYPDLF
ncbi:MAG TPA: hypothetical protein PLD27_00285 [bacterium]|nr:hypothetical protein [bacterium]HOL47379.1 hypothetical protein [bacterium]HPQ18122.1 hypothetical protein [bacterium]